MEGGDVLYERYERHYSQARQKILEMLSDLEPMVAGGLLRAAISGSAGIGLAEAARLPFQQEVFVVGELVRALAPDTNVVVELGGEDAKIIFFDRATGGMDERIERQLRRRYGRVHRPDGHAPGRGRGRTRPPQPAFHAHLPHRLALRRVCQDGHTAAAQSGRAQGRRGHEHLSGHRQPDHRGPCAGRRIEGKVLFLGGPLYYCQGLRPALPRNPETLRGGRDVPRVGRFAVARGAAMFATRAPEAFTLAQLRETLATAKVVSRERRRCRRCLRTKRSTPPLPRATPALPYRARNFPLSRRGVSGHRLRQHHHQAGARFRKQRTSVYLLRLQQRRPGRDRAPRVGARSTRARRTACPFSAAP